MHSEPTLLELAELARRSVEPGLMRSTPGKPISAGSCLHASLVLIMLIRRFGKSYHALVRGGRPEGAGARDAAGAWRGHYWIEVTAPDRQTFVVDTTADQFGFAPVLVLTFQQAANRYRPGPQIEVDEALAELAGSFGCRDLATV